MRLFVICLTLLAIGCTATPTDPMLADAGPRPIGHEHIVETWLADHLLDPYSVRDLTISEPRQGTVWTGLLNQGAVPAWYVCAGLNARNAYGGYTGRQIYVLFIRDGRVIADERAGPSAHTYTC